MFSTLSGFFSSSPPTRFTDSKLLAKLPSMINELHNKVDELKKDSDKAGAGSIDYLKYRIMDTLQTALDTKIKLFNDTECTPDNVAEILALVKDLHRTANTMLIEHEKTLAIERNYYRQVADNAVIVSCYASVFAASAVLPFATVATLISLYYVGPEVCNRTRYVLSTNTPRPASFMLLNRLVTTLEEIGNQIDPSINWQHRQQYRPPQAQQAPPNNTIINNDPDGYLEILLMRPDTPEDIFMNILKKHYQMLSLIYHPDKRADKDNTLFFKMKNAYDYLSNEDNRKRYCKHKIGKKAYDAAD